MTGGTSGGAAGRAALPVEGYALIGDTQTPALVGRNGVDRPAAPAAFLIPAPASPRWWA
jgi:hypothetical protein